MFDPSRGLFGRLASRWTVVFEMARLLAAEALDLRALFDHVTQLPAVRARVPETRVVEHDRRLLARLVANIDVRRQRGIIDVGTHVEKEGRVAVARTEMIARGVDSRLTNDVAVLRQLLRDCRERELCRDSL